MCPSGHSFPYHAIPLLLCASVTVVSAQLDFEIETVATEASSGFSASLVLDGQGTPHIAYIEEGSRLIRYAVNTGAGWTIELVEDYADLRTGVALVLPPADVPGIAHAGGYMRKTNGAWEGESYGTFGGWSSTVAVAPDGQPRAVVQWSYGSGVYQGWISYAYRHEGVWDYTDFGGAPFVPSSPHASLVIDTGGDPHAAYTTNYGDPLHYWHSDGFTSEYDDFTPGSWSDIVLDDAGSPRISYYDIDNGDLMLARKLGGNWQTVPLDTEGNVGLYTSHVFRDGTSHITYYNATNGDLMYAAVRPDGTTIQPVDTDGDVGRWTSLALDAQNKVHIAYHDVTNGDLKYAVSTTPVPVENTSWGAIKSIFGKRE